jgi:sulfonate dioxygenase
MSATETITEIGQSLPTLTLRSAGPSEEQKAKSDLGQGPIEEYRYANLAPHLDREEHYPPLTPFEHNDAGHRALSLPNPRAFLDSATRVAQITPRLGTEVTGVNLAQLDASGRDQLALEVSATRVR